MRVICSENMCGKSDLIPHLPYGGVGEGEMTPLPLHLSWPVVGGGACPEVTSVGQLALLALSLTS